MRKKRSLSARRAWFATSVRAPRRWSPSTGRSGGTRSTAPPRRRCWRRTSGSPPTTTARVMVLTGAGDEAFCAGADLKALETLDPDAPAGPMGFTRLMPAKPAIAAIGGWCVAGGLELALWCDLRVAAEARAFGCLERRWGVPLIDGGTQRLPRVVGLGPRARPDPHRPHGRGRRGARDRARQRGRPGRPPGRPGAGDRRGDRGLPAGDDALRPRGRARRARPAARRTGWRSKRASARPRSSVRWKGRAGSPNAGRVHAMSYFVTGATGFIGRHLVERLLERDGGGTSTSSSARRRPTSSSSCATAGAGRTRVKPVFGDLTRAAARASTTPRASSSQGVDHFFHLAAIYDMTADETQNATAQRRRHAERDRPRQRDRRQALPPHLLDRRRRQLRRPLHRGRLRRGAGAPDPLPPHEVRVREARPRARRGPVAGVPPVDRRRQLADRRDGQGRRALLLLQGDPEDPPRAAAVVPARLARVRAAPTSCRSTTSPRASTTSPTRTGSTARRSTSSTRSRRASGDVLNTFANAAHAPQAVDADRQADDRHAAEGRARRTR